MIAFNPLTTYNWVNSANVGAWAVGLALVTELLAARLCADASNKRWSGSSGNPDLGRSIAARRVLVTAARPLRPT